VIPVTIEKAAGEGGWLPTLVVRRSRQFVWCFLQRGDLYIWIRRDRWRHTVARAYRGDALTSVLHGQRAVAEFLEMG
jgi:hypothetical protein